MAKRPKSIHGITKTAARKREMGWAAHDVIYLVHGPVIMTILEMKVIHSASGLKGLKDCWGWTKDKVVDG
jgi:hypothetical protein